MRWAEAMRGVSVVQASGGDAEIDAVEYDSRRVGQGAAFVAMRGGTTDGNRYVDLAIAQGAAAVVTDSAEMYAKVRREHREIAVAQVEHGRRGLAELGAAVLGHPERRLAISAVTGTNGKTTTAYLLEQMLRAAGRKTVLLGTIETHVGDEVRASPHTTPEATDTLRVFADGVRVGASEALMEMSSHALDQERVWGFPVDVAIFTNLTQDHLDYHGTMEWYLAAKTRLFEGVGSLPPRIAVINEEDYYGSRIARQCSRSELMMYDTGDYGSYRAEDVQLSLCETRFTFATPMGRVKLRSPLSGQVNVSNLLAASCAALARGLTLEQVASGVERLQQVPGRFQVVSGSSSAGITVIVDYAHTDDALKNLIALARQQVGVRDGRVTTLFGCGGDRDRSKRPKMGRAAAEQSDFVIVTSDNPRSENPMAIIEEALVGVRMTNTPCIVEPDREAAIVIAIRSARAGDIVLLAGKGHEKVQILRDGSIPFDDVAVAAAVLKEMR